MRKMFCIECGKTAAAGNFCDDCFLKKYALFSIRNFSLKACECGSYLDAKWEIESLEDIIKRKIKTENEIKKIDINMKSVGNRVYAEITCTGFIHPSKKKKTESKKIILTIKKNKCDYCSRLAGGYYEALVQIRGPKREAILERFIKSVPKKSIVSIKEDKLGFDIKIMTKRTVTDIPCNFKDCEVQISYKHVATKKGKKIYRNFYAIR